MLTAAHCVDGKPNGTNAIEAYFGTLFGDEDPAAIGTIAAQSWQVFDPNWSFDGNDIAVVKLAMPMRYPMPTILPQGEIELVVRVRDEIASSAEKALSVSIALPGEELPEQTDGGCSVASPNRSSLCLAFLMTFALLFRRRRTSTVVTNS